jgi:hypothetical protein
VGVEPILRFQRETDFKFVDYNFVVALWRVKEAKSRKSFLPPMNIDIRDSMLLLALIYFSGVLWHLDEATGKRSKPLWSLLWPLALWLNVRGKHAKRNCRRLSASAPRHNGLESKRGRIRRLKYWQTMLAVLATLSSSMALAEDFKTIKGKEYKDATITRIERDGIVLRTKTGISKLYFVELPKDVQEKFHHGQPAPSAAQREREAIKSGVKQDVRGQSDKSRSATVVGQSAVSLKIFVAAIVVLVGVVVVIVRSRFYRRATT